jgi:hypothetical protein
MSGMAMQSTFKAWIDKMPGAGNKLIVTGEVEFPTSGWKIEIVEANVPAIPETIVLDIRSTAPTGTVLQVITRLPVRFEKPKSPDYSNATIRGAGPDFTVEVEIIS